MSRLEAVETPLRHSGEKFHGGDILARKSLLLAAHISCLGASILGFQPSQSGNGVGVSSSNTAPVDSELCDRQKKKRQGRTPDHHSRDRGVSTESPEDAVIHE